MKKIAVLYLVVSCFLFVGCSSTNKHQRVFHTERGATLGKFGFLPYAFVKQENKVCTLATEADTRTILVIQDKSGSSPKILAEASPDVIDELTKKFSLLLDAAIRNAKNSELFKTSVESLTQYSQTVAKLTTRSQGVIYFRDASYRLMEAYLNKAITEEQFVELFTIILNNTKELIGHELLDTLSQPNKAPRLTREGSASSGE